MHGVFKNSIQYIKKMFREAPFLSWCIVYLFFLSFEWDRIGLWSNQYRLIVRIFLLSIIPFLLWWYEARKSRKAYKLRISTFRENRIIPKHEIDHLKALFPDSQIDLFEKVLLPSLSMFYATFSETGQEDYYKKKLEAISKMAKELKRNPTLYSNQPQYKYRDIALTAFSFYRVLFSGTIEFFCGNTTQNNQKDNADIWVLLKRVPAKLSLVLGAQHWRLYEFWEAVYGDPGRLQLNGDIIDYLIMRDMSTARKIDVSSKSVSDHVSGEVVRDNATNMNEQKTPLSQQNDNAESTQKIWLEEETSNIRLEECQAQEKVSSDENKNSGGKQANKFITWLIKKINGDDKRYKLNDGDYIFISPLLYDASVFITESLLNKYYQISNISPDGLREILIKQHILDGKQYLIKNDTQKISLMRLNNVSVQKTASKVVSIEESVNADNGTQDEVTNNGNETESSD